MKNTKKSKSYFSTAVYE